MPAAHLCAGKIVGISLDAGDDLTEDDTIREHVRLVGRETSVSLSGVRGEVSAPHVHPPRPGPYCPYYIQFIHWVAARYQPRFWL